MKLNKKGYMLVEIVIASVLAFGIAYYLLSLTYNFKNTNADISESIIYENTKRVITKNIMGDLENGYVYGGYVSGSSTSGDYILLPFYKYDNSSELEFRRLEIVRVDNKTILKYGKWYEETQQYDTSDVSYYEKEFSSILMVGDLELDTYNEYWGVISVGIPISSIYDDNQYDIKLVINYRIEDE